MVGSGFLPQNAALADLRSAHIGRLVFALSVLLVPPVTHFALYSFPVGTYQTVPLLFINFVLIYFSIAGWVCPVIATVSIKDCLPG